MAESVPHSVGPCTWLEGRKTKPPPRRGTEARTLRAGGAARTGEPEATLCVPFLRLDCGIRRAVRTIVSRPSSYNRQLSWRSPIALFDKTTTLVALIVSDKYGTQPESENTHTHAQEHTSNGNTSALSFSTHFSLSIDLYTDAFSEDRCKCRPARLRYRAVRYHMAQCNTPSGCDKKKKSK